MGLTQISTNGVKDNAVTAGKIPANAVGVSEIANDAVTTGKIADSAVTDAKIASGISASKITGLATDSITEGNSTAEVLDTGSNGIFRFLPEGVEKFRIDTNGNVGIGTAFPASESINGSQNLVIMDTTSDGGMNIKTGTSANAQIHFSDTSGNGQGRLIYDHSNDSMKLYTSGSERMRINSDGRVGIGKTPSTTLDIETASNANGFNLNCVGTPANYLFNVRDDNVSKFYIKGSDSSIGIQTDEPINPLEIAKAAHYTTANSGQARSGIHIRGNYGNAGEYGGGISFGCKATAGASNGAAAIAARQATQDSDTVGLSFFTHPSSDGSAAAQEKLRIHHDGRIQPIYSSGAQATGGVMTVGAFNAKMNGHDSEGVLKARTDISHQSVFDAGGWYDNTNFRYNPQVKGYYIFHVTVMFFTGMNSNSVEQSVAIRLNGSTVHGYTDGYSTNYGNYSKHSFHGVVKCDGNNDYVDVTASSSASTQIHSASNWSGWLLYPEA